MAAVLSIINYGLAMLKEPEPEMRMINVVLMGFLVDRGTVRPTITPLGFSEALAAEILTCLSSVLEEGSDAQQGGGLW